MLIPWYVIYDIIYVSQAVAIAKYNWWFILSLANNKGLGSLICGGKKWKKLKSKVLVVGGYH